MIRGVVLCCAIYFLSLSLPLVKSMTDEQKAMIHEHFEKVGLECLKGNMITEDDIKNLRARKMPEGENAPCFLACMFRSIGIIDDKGLMQKENALELAKTVFKDPEELKMIADYIHSCSHINSEAVSDGEKGCDRSINAYKCMVENGKQFGFDV